MAKYIDWYLVELEGLVERRMPPDQVHNLLAQAETHLLESAQDLAATGMTAKDSELAAIERFGKARKIAAEATPGKGGIGMAEAFTLGSFTLFGATLTWFVCSHGHFGIEAYEPVVLSVCAAIFVVATLLSRRVLWRELGILTAVGFVAICLAFGYSFAARIPDSRESISKYAAEINVQSAGIASEIDLLKARMAQYDGVFLTYPSEVVTNNKPHGLYIAESIRYVATKSTDVAHQGWKKAPEYLSQLEQSHGNTETLAKELTGDYQASPLASAVLFLPLVAVYCLTWLGGALGLNALFFSLRSLGTVRAIFRRKYA